MDEPVGVCVRRLRCHTNTAAASIATSRQPPSASPIARPGPASSVAAEMLVPFSPTSGNGGGAGEGTPTSGEVGGGEGEGGGGKGLGGGGDGSGGGGEGEGGGGKGLGGGDGGSRGGGEGAGRMTWTWTSTTDGAAGASSMVIPNTLLIVPRGFVCKATAADSTWLAPAVSVATTVRITLPALTVTVSMHAGGKHLSSWRKLSLTESALAWYSSMVPPAFSTKVTSLAGTISLNAPGCNGSGGFGGEGGCGCGDGGDKGLGDGGDGSGGLGKGGGGGDGSGGLGEGSGSGALPGGKGGGDAHTHEQP